MGSDSLAVDGLLRVGWREWLALPDLGIPAIKAKIDTGAKTSSIHAVNIRTEERDGRDYALFEIAPLREHSNFFIHCQAPVVGEREVRSSNGQVTIRLFVRSRLIIAGIEWSIQMSLADRASMKFPMLLGRQAMGRRVAVEPGRSYLTGRRLPHIYREWGLPKKRKAPK